MAGCHCQSNPRISASWALEIGVGQEFNEFLAPNCRTTILLTSVSLHFGLHKRKKGSRYKPAKTAKEPPMAGGELPKAEQMFKCN